MELPEWHETELDADDVVNLKQIAEMPDAPDYAALRSYATGRREHHILGPMPTAVARISNRRLWMRSAIETWLHIPLLPMHRQGSQLASWIARGRPRIPS